MIRPVFIFLLIAFCWRCSTKKSEEKQKEADLVFDNLVGTWKMEDDEQFERWAKNSDGSFSATVFTVEGIDTVVSEKIKIYERDGKWDFETIVTGQNKGKPIDFLSVILNDTVVQFENVNHDFPKLINYTMLGDRNLRAFIAGKTDTIYFNYVKVRIKQDI